jgi:hypothetical protein
MSLVDARLSLENQGGQRKKALSGKRNSVLTFADDLDIDIANEIDCFADVNQTAANIGGRKSLTGFRRSSVGGVSSKAPSLSETEQNRIAEMYKTVIQMSSENVSYPCC